MANRLEVVAVVAALMIASVVLFAVQGAPSASVGSRVPSATTVAAAALTPTINYTYYDFFNVPYGEWWDMRTNAKYGDEPVGASCFNATSVSDGTCTTNVTGLPRVAQYPYEDWSGPGTGPTSIYAPYRVKVAALNLPGYNLSQPVFLPVLNYAAAPGTQLSFNWNMQYLNMSEYHALTSAPLSCYASSAALADEGYQLRSKIYLTMDNEEAARLFGAPVSSTLSTISNWWSTNTLPGCSSSKTQSGALETSVNSWFATEANGKYDICNAWSCTYVSLYTNITATVVSAGPTGLTNVYIEHGAWGTEALLSRWFYWGNATYAGNAGDSSKARGWWGMENGWWEGVHYAGALTTAAMNFNLTGVLQYHFQEHSAPGPDGCLRGQTGCTEVSPSDDTPYWTWGPQLMDYVASTTSHPNSELDRYAGLNYIKTTPGSVDYGTNTSFDYTPISWAAKAGETWYFIFPTNSSAYYQNPATATLGTSLPTAQLPSITSSLALQMIFPPGYGTWNAAAHTWSVTGGTAESWPTGTPGSYPSIPYPGIYLHPGSIPPSVTTNAASGITTSGATLNGNLGSLGSASSVSVGFLWGTSSTLSGATNVSLGTHATGAFSTSLSSLTPGTTYYFEAWASGNGFAKGSILSFQTSVTPPSVTTNAATAIGTTTATLNGATSSLGTASSISVGFLWGTSPTLVGPTNVTVGTQTVAGAFSSGLTTLTPGTTYYFQAWALGNGFAKGSILSFTTSVTPPSVTTSAATSIGTTTATLNGNLGSLGTAASVTVGFLYGTSPTLAGATNASLGAHAIGAFSDPVTGLTADTTYYFEAWANGQGFTHGVILSFTTGTTPPSVTTSAATAITTTGATLNGATSSLGTAASVGVGFLWGTSPTLAAATNLSAGSQTVAGAFTAGVSSLTPGSTYYFQAWANGNGFAKGSILSFVTSVTPPSVATNPASAISTTTATLNGATSSLGTASSVSVGFLYGTSPTLSGATNATVTTQTVAGAFSLALSSLSPGTTYYFQAWANGQGFAKGSILGFVTSVTPPAVTTNAASGVTTTAATLNGATSSLGTASSVGVGFLWGTSPTLVGATNVTAGTQTLAGSFSTALASLTPGTTYYFAAWANGNGFVRGAILNFVTSVTPPSVTTNAASSIGTTGATLNGNLASLGTASSVTVGFLYGTSPTLLGATNASLGTHAVGAFSDPISGLSPGTTYYFEAWANGNGFATGGILSFMTGTTPPSVSTNAATGITSSGATLNGATSSLGTAASVGVGFYWGTSPTLAGATNASVTTQTVAGSFSLALSSLTPGVTYYFQAWANGNGFVKGSILSFTTGISPPVVQTNAATGITTTTATLNGATSSLGTASSISVGFLWGTSSTLSGATNVTVGTQTVAGAFSSGLTTLTPGTTYYFQAWANGQGFVKGVILSFTTSVTPPSVSTNPASGIGTTTATLNGATSSLGTASSVNVGFLYGTSPTLVGATNVTVGSQTVAGAFFDALSGLTPGTTYYFQAWANGNGFVKGSILSFTTSVTPPSVTTSAATSIGTTGATLNGNLGSLGTAASVTVGFLYGTSPTLLGATNVSLGAHAVGAFSDPISSLTPGTTYYFEAWANGQGFAHGVILSFTTSVTPPSVTTNAASGVTTTAATLNGATSSLGTASSVSVGFLWGTSPTLSGATNVSAGTQTVAGAFSSALVGLTPGVAYYFEAWANGQGFATGGILSFTAGVSPPVVQTNAAAAITTSGATLNGATSDLGTAASVTVGFLWGTSPTLAGATNVTVTTQTVAGAFSDVLGGLTPGTTYYFQAWANGNGFAKGSILSFRTSVTPPTVTTNAASGITTTGATLNGNLGSLGTASSVNVGFLYGTSPSLLGATNVSAGTLTVAGVFLLGISGLTPGTIYYFQAWANGQGFAHGAILSFTTSVTPPSVTTNAASGVGTTTATLNGATSSLGTATSVSVGFRYGTSSTLAGATNVTVTSQTVAGAFFDALSSLTPGTTYYFQAWVNGNGFAVGSILSFTTSVAPPSVATNPASGITTTAATLNGATSDLGTASSVSVGFLWGTSPSLLGATNVTVTTQTVAGAYSDALSSLTPGTTYYFEAWALGDGFAHGVIVSFTAGTSPPSVATNAATGISTDAATLNGATSSLGTAASVDVGFFWGTSPTLSGATNVSATTQTLAGSFSLALSSLTPGVTYYFQAWANGDGFAVGSIVSFTTSVTPPSVTTNAASGVATSAATLNGNLASLGTATSVSVGFLWGTSPSLIGAANVTVGTLNAPGGFMDSLSSLTPGTTYYFEAWANGQAFALGGIVSFTTGTTPPSVTTNPASGVGTTTATLNGATSDLGTAPSVSVGFLWGTSPTLVGATNVTLSPQTVAGAFADPLSGLTPGTTYYFAAWANGDGFVEGSILSFTTALAPPVVQTNAASGITTTTATLNGATTDLGSAASVDVGFLYGTSPTLAGATNATVTSQSAAGAFSLPLSGLAPGTTYYFQAWANADGFAVGSILSFTTAPFTYAVTFTESGLPSGTMWSVTLAGSTLSSTGTQIAFQEPNGTYVYTVGAVSGYTASPSSGSVHVAGGTVDTPIAFSPTTPTLCADLYNRSAWVSSRHLKLSKTIVETFYGQVTNCGNTPVSVYVLFKVYADHKGVPTLIGTFATPVYVGLLPGKIVTLSVDWVNPPSGGYTATAQAFYGAVGTTPATPGATVRTLQFKVDPPTGKSGVLTQVASTVPGAVWSDMRLPLRLLRDPQIL